jgi:polyadenylate-binding protein
MNGTAKLGSTDLSVSIHIRQADRQTTDIFTNLRVSNLESTTTADDLRKLFESFGEITSTFVPPPKSESDAQYYGFVSFKNPEHAAKAIE